MSTTFISKKLSETKNIEIVQYTTKSIAITGSDTKEFEEDLSAIGGFFNKYLKCGPGWIFSKREESKVVSLLKKLINNEGCCKVSYKPRDTSKCFTFLSSIDLHEFYSQEKILELLKNSGYKYPEKFFRQISTHTGNKVPKLLEETENGWKVIHDCIQKCSFKRKREEFDSSQYVSRTEFDVANTRISDIKDQITRLDGQVSSYIEEDEDFEEEEEDEDFEEEDEDFEEDDEDSETDPKYVSREEFNLVNSQIRDLQDQINKIKLDVYKIGDKSNIGSKFLPTTLSPLSEETEDYSYENDIHNLEKCIQEVEESSKKCDRCVTM